MNVIKLQRKFPQFEQSDIFGLADAFRKLDVDDKGYVDEATAIKATQASERQPYDVVRQALKEVDLDSSRRVELEDYVGLIAKLRDSSPAQVAMRTGGAAPASPGGVVAQRTGGMGGGHASKGSIGGKIHVQGSNANITHTINEDERTEFTRHINAVLAGDADIGDRLPFPTDTFEMFDECRDGLVLAKLINDSVPDTIDERVMNVPGRKIKKLNAFHMTENNNIVIESAKGIGCSVVNIGSGDIIEVREHLILGLIWQIIRRGLLGKIDIKLHPELYRLLEEDETLEQFLRLPPEQILLRWFNYHLKAANWPRRVTNFSTDVKDGENYAVLQAQIGSEYGCSRAPLQTRDPLQRAEEVLQDADKLGCRKFLTPKSLVAGNPKLNLAFVANLFNTHPCLEPITEEEKQEVEDFDAEGEREARVFTLWLNSLDVQPSVQSFFDDLRDGTVLLQAYDKVIKGSVNWRHANKPPANGGEMMRFKAVENTNYAIELGKQNGFSLVGIQGADITDGQKTLTLGLVWQLMRKNITITLGALAQRLGKREMTDAEMVRWANDMSRKGGKSSAIRSFKDQSIGTGVFLLDVLNGMKASYVDYDLVTPGHTDDDAYLNAKLSISIARKMGATIWLVPEDICQVRSRLVTTFIGSLMATYEKMQ
ncbi:Fimbrin [Cytospora mali]|uniref:Fimbrin n=2 Tax=Cytospora mali TaxID=578113 RepID=A0A194WDG4_CYTMA|nr:Fimbrin [Valsa mali var. pyri (nom. inval.)]KUI74382.1 Fimbrin [Valsa mali]